MLKIRKIAISRILWSFRKILLADVSGRPRRITVPNFVKIGQSVAKILRFVDFSRWRPSAILDLFGAYLDHSQWVLEGIYHSAKFGYWGFGQFDPINGLQYHEIEKRHTLAWVRIIWAIKRENVVSGLTSRWVIFHLFAQMPPMDGFPPHFAQL